MRILEAARGLLTVEGDLSGFTMDAIARLADVARMTVYNQFGSKVGLLEALCDSLAQRGGMEQMTRAFHLEEPLAALAEYIRVFSGFWAADRLATRRLRGLAALDQEIARVIRARDERRRRGLQFLLQRITEKYGHPAPEEQNAVVNLLWVLIGFETFDALAGPERSTEEVTPQVQHLVFLALGIPDQEPDNVDVGR
jgi:AcrR family transcriptional regulator